MVAKCAHSSDVVSTHVSFLWSFSVGVSFFQISQKAVDSNPQQITNTKNETTQFPVSLLWFFRSGALDFEEFSALLKDMHADKAVAEKRMRAYHLPPSLLKEFSPEAIEEMRVTFAMFDESGDGALDEEELEGLLRTFGQEPTKEKVAENYKARRDDCLCCSRSTGACMLVFAHVTARGGVLQWN